MDSNKPSVNSESSIDKHEYSEYITPRAIDNVCDTRFFREALFCLYKKFDGSSFFFRHYASFLKKMLKLVTRPIHDELIKDELFDQNKNRSVKDDTYSFDIDGVHFNFYLPYARFDLIQQTILKCRNFDERELLEKVHKKYLKPGFTYLDCGANIGNHCLFFACIARSKKIFAFEGCQPTYDILVKNIEVNNLQNVITAYNCVLGEKAGVAEISNCDLFNFGGTNFTESKESDGIEMKPLDSFGFGEKIDFVKMDVEGFEYKVLKGGRNLLINDKPILWVEIFSCNYAKVSELLAELGYRQIEALDKNNYIFASSIKYP